MKKICGTMYIQAFRMFLREGDRLFTGDDDLEADYEMAVDYYRKAEKGKAPNPSAKKAQYRLGYCYEHGLGVRKNKGQALRWYKKSAKAGYEPAQKRLNTGEADSPVVIKSRNNIED